MHLEALAEPRLRGDQAAELRPERVRERLGERGEQHAGVGVPAREPDGAVERDDRLPRAGGPPDASRAVEAAAGRSKVLAISVLTSIDAAILSQIGITTSPQESVLRLVKLAEAAGADGVVASPQEVKNIRSEISRPEFLVVTPGIRPATNASKTNEDQKRVATPAAAIADGASYLVVGRPITGAPDPVQAAEEIIAEMERAE